MILMSNFKFDKKRSRRREIGGAEAGKAANSLLVVEMTRFISL